VAEAEARTQDEGLQGPPIPVEMIGAAREGEGLQRPPTPMEVAETR
jgi:hypothetical protein